MMTTTMPPTTHALPHAQRLRLMRSTRKLEAVLGETPLLVDSSSPHAYLGHGRSISAVPQAALPQTPTVTLRRAASTQVRSQAPRPLLVIDLPTRASPDVDSLMSPDVLSAGAESCPPSPLTPTNFGDVARRRKLAKVVHMLGENVPPSLVFPMTNTMTKKGRRRASTLSVPESVRERLRISATTPSIPEYAHDDAVVRPSLDTLSSREHLISRSGSRRARADEMYRREKEWSGEWSGGAVRNMDDITKSLRGLRLK